MCAVAQCHEASLTAQPLRARICACVFVLERRKLDSRPTFDLLSEVIFKDLAVPAVTVKLTLGNWFVLAVVMTFY